MAKRQNQQQQKPHRNERAEQLKNTADQIKQQWHTAEDFRDVKGVAVTLLGETTRVLQDCLLSHNLPSPHTHFHLNPETNRQEEKRKYTRRNNLRRASLQHFLPFHFIS
ncbi:unnamed protein product [Prunus brigantina]